MYSGAHRLKPLPLPETVFLITFLKENHPSTAPLFLSRKVIPLNIEVNLLKV